MHAVQFARGKSGIFTHTMFSILPLQKAWQMMAGKWAWQAASKI